jgi:hypothetical protein
MESTMGQQTKTFIWSMYGDDFIKVFDRFMKLSLVDGKHVTVMLSSLIEDHVKRTDIQGTLVDEKQLLDELQKNSLSISRVTLRNYRERMVKDGKPIWFTDGRNICYHLEDCLEFFRQLKGRKNENSSLA